MSRGLTLMPILLGAAAGAVVAVMQAPKPSAGTAPAKAPALAASAAARPEAPTAHAAEPDSRQAKSVESAAPASSSPEPAKPRPVFDLSEPKTAAELLETQIACNRKQPEACERAARALTTGGAGTRDPARAHSLMRIALTIYVKQCEGSRPAACARLAEMYEAGETVQKSEKSVLGLRARVTELCRTRPTELGCATPP